LFGIAAREEVNNPTAAVNDVNLLAFVGFLFGPPLIGYVAKSISISACMIILGVTWALVAAILLASGRLTSSQ